MDFDDPLKLATDSFITYEIGFRFAKQTHIYGSIRYTLHRIFEAGILQFYLPALVKDLEEPSKLEIHEKQNEYSTLRWDQLYPGFYIWLFALIVCISVFIGEIIFFNFCNENKKL